MKIVTHIANTVLIGIILNSSHLVAGPNFEEKNGLLVVEAEHYSHQAQDNTRRWYQFDKNTAPHNFADSDDVHYQGASSGAYLEILPDTRTHHGEKLINGVNFTNEAGKMAILSYPVYFNTAGTYYVWARAHSTGPEDNGLHVGIDGQWPASASRLQFCSGKHSWTWSSAQRVPAKHCGTPQTLTIKIDKPGIHTLHVSMREDGFELDKIILAKDKQFIPTKHGPPETLSIQNKAAKKTELLGIKHYQKIYYASDKLNFKDPVYLDEARQAIAIKATNKSARDKYFGTSLTWKQKSPVIYDLVLVTLAEIDGESNYKVKHNGKVIGKFKNPETKTDYSEAYFHIKGVNLKKGDTLTVESTAVTNGKIPEGNATAYARGRWKALVLQRPQ